MRFKILMMAALAGTAFAGAQDWDDPTLDGRMSCTSIMVGKKASTDGSVMTSHTCDGNYRTWVDIVPGYTNDKDTTVAVYTGRMHTDLSTGTRGMEKVGEIPDVRQTYRFVNTAYPCLNEKQLGIGETTISGRSELRNKKGLFYIEELERLALQRCTTAREAIRLMDKLTKEYGYGDDGECLTIADPDEVWHFEIFGAGPDKIGAVWAAVRIPDDHVGVSANVPRISTLNLADTANYMASENVYAVAKRMKLWDGKEEFKFWKAYAGGNYFNEPKAYSVREYYLLNKIAPSLGLTQDMEELPVSVKPDRQLSAADVMYLLTETYEGSDMDPIGKMKVTRKVRGSEKIDTITSPYANPWMTGDMRTLVNSLKPETAPGHRTVAVPNCAYSTVIQLRGWLPDAVGGVVWLSFDNPGQSPRIPVFSGTTELPMAFNVCGQWRNDPTAIVWAFREANKLATVKYGQTRDMMRMGFDHFVDKGQSEMPYVESRYASILAEKGETDANAFLTGYTRDFAGSAVAYWDELARKMWAMYCRAF